MYSGNPVGPAVPSSTPPAIPYLQQPPVSGGHVLSVFLITAALLGLLLAVLAICRKAGWLSRFGVQGASSGERREKEDALRVLGSAALGAGSRAFLLQAGGSQYLIVESSRRVSVKEIVSRHGAPHESA
ncbi:flagellar biosynthetic protein FliO [Dyella ginsengisoli]|uniref:flagellar biosynthetic protein FliO n=1 Tax=Dyella ginsengisoli TaxID=363848 RepID=UPI0012FDF14E|nr:flagellar biosynthetic protein FliO [Dyella ginsengisoli]